MKRNITITIHSFKHLLDCFFFALKLFDNIYESIIYVAPLLSLSSLRQALILELGHTTQDPLVRSGHPFHSLRETIKG